MKIKELTKKEGITLIALVITILILLILAGITITAITGENGLLSSALKAKEETEIENEKEIISRATAQTIGEDDRGDVKKETLQENLDNEATKGKTEVKEKDENFEVIFTDSKRHYLVDKDGNVRKEEWWSEKDEEENNYITNGNIKLQTGDYILYDANDNGEYTYTSTAERTGIASGENQTFSSNYETKWRLLGVENTESGDYLILVPATPIKSTSQKGLMLKGSIGYQYGIDEIENISKIYGNGNGASHSRAIKIEDINKITGYNPLKTGDGKIFREGTANEYNNKLTVTRTGRASNELSYSNGLKTTYTYTAYKYFNEKREWTTLEIGETITITSTYYFYYPTTLTTSSNGEIKGITTDSREYGMLFSNNKSYWIASSYSLGGNNEEAISHTYGFFNVGQGYIRSCMDNYLIYVGGNTKQLEKNIIPIVCLDANIKLKATGNSINNKFTEWNIEK